MRNEKLREALEQLIESCVTDADTCSICLQDLTKHASGCPVGSGQAALAAEPPKQEEQVGTCDHEGPVGKQPHLQMHSCINWKPLAQPATDDALGTPKAWRQAVSDPNAPSTFEALIMEMRAKWYLPTVQEYASKLAALAPHYVHKDKLRELRDKWLAYSNTAELSRASCWHACATALTALLEQP